jgi:peptidoglycan/xylan/chitin deacetylase (PgdA/CDA1 family)
MLRGKIPLVPYSVAVTVDDGYRDFYTVAYPVFSAFEIPVTVYLVTDFIDGRLWPWVDQVRYAFRNTVHSRFEITLPNGKPLAFSCVDENERIAAGRSTCEALKQLEDRDRVAVLQLLPQLLGVELPADPPGGGEPLGWDEVQSMARAGVEFGAHTRTHPILSKVGSRSVLEDEIAGSKRRIEEILEVPVRHFCYPNGSVQDVSPEAVEVVRQAGFETAVTTQGGLNVPMGDMLRLRRIAVDPAYDPQYFAQCAAAFRV